MKAADISDEVALDAIRQTQGMNGVPHWSALSDVQSKLQQFPEKVVLAKLARLVKRGLIDGCACGCRGDFSFPEQRSQKPKDKGTFLMESGKPWDDGIGNML